MKRLATAIAAIALIGTPAFAADMAVKTPVKAPPPAPVAPVVNWIGYYIGGNLGGVVEHASGTSDFLDTLTGPGDTGFPTNPQSNSFSSTRFWVECRPGTTGSSIRDGWSASKVTGIGPAPATASAE